MKSKRRLFAWLAILGPGLMVMLADTDAGSIVTAAQSGAQWGYRLILPQILLIPVLYMIQEMTARIGIVTKKGHAELIRQHFGRGWAVFSVGTLLVAAVGALVTEFAGISGVGQLFGISPWFTVVAATSIMVGIGFAGSYRRVEHVGIALGLFELLFIPAAFLAHPDPHAFAAGLWNVPLLHRDYLLMLTANIGAVIMPWMIFYQQDAVIDKGLGIKDLHSARVDTFFGSIATQLVMIFVVVAAAATIGRTGAAHTLTNIQDITQALEPFLGYTVARVFFGLGLLGAAFVAALVVSLAGAWAVGEAFGFPHSLNDKLREGRWFYLVYTLVHVGGAALVLTGIPLVRLTIEIEVMNALLLPIVLGFLLALEARALPERFRMKGWYRAFVWTVSGVVMAFGLYMAVSLAI